MRELRNFTRNKRSRMGRKKLAQNEDGRESKKVEELFKEFIEEYEKDTIELRNFTRNQRSRMGRNS